jgi:hypothetical protein
VHTATEGFDLFYDPDVDDPEGLSAGGELWKLVDLSMPSSAASAGVGSPALRPPHTGLVLLAPQQSPSVYEPNEGLNE